MGRSWALALLIGATTLGIAILVFRGDVDANPTESELRAPVEESMSRIAAQQAATGASSNVREDTDRTPNVSNLLPPGATESRAMGTAATAPELPPPDAITMSDDGSVSVHVDNVSLAWLLDELERARDGLAPPLVLEGDDRELLAQNEPVESAPERLLRALREGSEADRYAALLYAQDEAIDIPADELDTTIASDASERVRLLAFARHVEQVVDDREALREVLTEGAYNYRGAAQDEARRQLEELNEYEAMQVAAPLQDAQ